MKSDISSLRILISCIWFFFCFFLKILICFFCFFTVFLRVIVLYSCWQFWKMKKKDVGVYVQFHKFRLLCAFACLWNFVLGYLENCFVAMGVLLQWCYFVIFEEVVVQRIFSPWMVYVKGFDEHLVRFEICKGIRKHISYLLVWNFMSFVGVSWK